ncbi:hypothetical protein ACIQFW_32935 [Streptomyces ardesiacus]|uniref:hypothetical protein n=1 Tax=Streptomyces ardesiacus TaxID=285564 RepID=UPI0038278B1E
MALPVSNIVKADPWAGYEWVVWQVEVDDPEQRISEPYNTAGVAFLLAEDSRKEMVDFAARLGCVYEGCRDDGTSGGDDDPCYTWWFRVPQTLHAQRSARGWPVVVEECRQRLNFLFADSYHWQGRVNGHWTRAFRDGGSLPSWP